MCFGDNMKKIEKKFNNKIFRINNFKSLGENILKIIKSISSYGVSSYAAETSFFIVLPSNKNWFGSRVKEKW